MDYKKGIIIPYFYLVIFSVGLRIRYAIFSTLRSKTSSPWAAFTDNRIPLGTAVSGAANVMAGSSKLPVSLQRRTWPLNTPENCFGMPKRKMYFPKRSRS